MNAHDAFLQGMNAAVTGPGTNAIRLEMTCGACPEQYDAFIGDEEIGYLRLRHGYFTVQFPDVEGECVYESETIGDGIFDESEREFHLSRAKAALAVAYSQRGAK